MLCGGVAGTLLDAGFRHCAPVGLAVAVDWVACLSLPMHFLLLRSKWWVNFRPALTYAHRAEDATRCCAPSKLGERFLHLLRYVILGAGGFDGSGASL